MNFMIGHAAVLSSEHRHKSARSVYSRSSKRRRMRFHDPGVPCSNSFCPSADVLQEVLMHALR
jgi:hypothetical protein